MKMVELGFWFEFIVLFARKFRLRRNPIRSSRLELAIATFNLLITLMIISLLQYFDGGHSED